MAFNMTPAYSFSSEAPLSHQYLAEQWLVGHDLHFRRGWCHIVVPIVTAVVVVFLLVMLTKPMTLNIEDVDQAT